MSLPGTLRRATPDDAPAVARLLQVAYKDNEKLGVEYNAAAVTEERVRRYLVRDEVWVLERDGRLVATVGLQRHIEVR
ncbi:MAG TPA: GNAT family N-acetyltransferase, partial [Candidatus Thermoplasmatota archaeon]|nr:GNAT family N-acetyltransferase [Candidatus Thermoplasmatota archaeon]